MTRPPTISLYVDPDGCCGHCFSRGPAVELPWPEDFYAAVLCRPCAEAAARMILNAETWEPKR